MAEIKSLIAELEKAERGSRKLDFKIGSYLGWSPPIARYREWGMWLAPGGEEAQLPWWTTSLDAKLPGEDIIQTAEQMTGNWMALQRRAKGDPAWEAAYAKTEALARRIAALKARDAS